ncbi:MAG: DUF6526 family protein [Thermoanaerobaculia bacterium]
MEKQNYATHRRFVPGYHYVLSLLALVALVGASVNFYRALSYQSGRIAGAVILVLVVCVIFEAYYLRAFALKAQDRVIRVEENLRHYILHGSLLDPQLDIRQIIGLRFASDAEFAPLVKRAVEEKLSENDIKKAVEDWRSDSYRV